MASATKRAQGKWLGRYRGPDGRERTKTFATKGEARAWAEAQEARMRSGSWTDPSMARVTVGDWSTRWLDSLNVKASTRLNYEALLRNHVLPRWGSTRLDRVSHAEVRTWIARLDLGPSKTRQAYLVLSGMLDLAVEDGRLPRNPARPVGRARGLLPKVTKTKEHRYLTHAQVARLADESGEYRPLILLMAYCGLRWGEAAALRVRDVDLLRGRVTVARAAVELPDGITYDTPKSHAQRSVPMPAALRAELEPLMVGKSADSLMFPSPHGGPLRASNFRQRHFSPAVKRAGLDITPHDLRHTAASLAIASGANVKAVQRMLGHQSAVMTLDTYAGLFDSDLEAVATRMDSAISDARADYLRTSTAITTLDESRPDAANTL